MRHKMYCLSARRILRILFVNNITISRIILQIAVKVPPAITSQTISATSVVAGDYITISVDATDVMGVSGVEARIQQPDGNIIQAVGLVNAAPQSTAYSNSFVTTGMNGLYHIDVYAIDGAGNAGVKDNTFAFFAAQPETASTIEGITVQEAPVIQAGETTTINAVAETSTAIDITTA